MEYKAPQAERKSAATSQVIGEVIQHAAQGTVLRRIEMRSPEDSRGIPSVLKRGAMDHQKIVITIEECKGYLGINTSRQ